MTRKSNLTALCSAVAFASADVPEWVHLLPAGEVQTVDGRGPYRVKSLQEIADASLKPGQKLPIDECHSIDKLAPIGMSSPARGWIVELQSRDDGIWGRVEWTGTGQGLLQDKAYLGLSPAILHTAGGEVLQILRASLTNTPNLQGLVSLHSEESQMDFKALLIKLLGLDAAADDAAIEAALTAKLSSGEEGKVSLQAAEILALPQFVALQSELTAMTANYNSLLEGQRKDAATTFVDAAIAQGRVGLKPVRDEYIALHMQDSARAEKLIGSMPKLGGALLEGEPGSETVETGLNSDDHLVMSLFGVEEEEYRASLKAGGVRKEVL